MSTDAILTLKDDLLELADLFAEAVVKRTNPIKDEITQRQARKEFGAVWLKDQEDRKRIKGRRKGAHDNSPIIYSRVELIAVREAEKQDAKMARRQKH